VPTDGLEQALTRFEREAAGAVRSLTAALREAKKLEAAAVAGVLRDLRAGLDSAPKLAEEAARAIADLRDAWTFDEQDYFAGGGYRAEVLAIAAAQGVQAFEADDRILSYPAIVQLSASDTTVIIDKKKDRRVRPSVLAFLEALAVAYDLTVARKGGRAGSTVKLVDVYAVLTVLPGAAREYTKQEFARDLYLLDQSGETVASDGRTLGLPASALTRGSGVLTTVARNGQAKVYAGITFDGATS
jgi:hypothetical protein